MLEEAIHQSESHTAFFYQYFKTTSKNNKQSPRYLSRYEGNHYQKFSRESCYKSRSHSRSKSHSKYYKNHSSQNHSPYYDRI